MFELLDAIVFIGNGIGLTLQLLAGGLALGLIFGSLFSVLRFKGIGIRLITTLVSVVRGTPLILQLSLIYFSAPMVIGIKLSILAAGIISFGLNSAAYMAEILRAGIENLPKGQFEAAQALRIPGYYMWKDIIFPQVIRNILPALVGETISLLKETALISTIGGMDLLRLSQVLAAQKFTYFMPLLIAGGYYYAMVVFVEYVGRKLEKRVCYVKRAQCI